jgi:hypothetical protein
LVKTHKQIYEFPGITGGHVQNDLLLPWEGA